MKHKHLHLLPLLLAVLILGVVVTPSAAHAQSFKLVVHESNPVRTLSADRASELFLKKATRWGDGRSVQPVDQEEDSSVRQAFSERVLNKDVSSVKSYWQMMIFSGRNTPPPKVSGDSEVLAYVRANPGAIGYVAADTGIGGGLAEVTLEN